MWILLGHYLCDLLFHHSWEDTHHAVSNINLILILSALLSVLFDQSRLKYGRLHSWNRSKKKRAKVQLLKWINVSYSEIKSWFFFLLFINFFWLRLCCIFVALCCKWKTGCDDALACGVWELLTSWHNHIFPFWNSFQLPLLLHSLHPLVTDGFFNNPPIFVSNCSIYRWVKTCFYFQ